MCMALLCQGPICEDLTVHCWPGFRQGTTAFLCNMPCSKTTCSEPLLCEGEAEQPVSHRSSKEGRGVPAGGSTKQLLTRWQAEAALFCCSDGVVCYTCGGGAVNDVCFNHMLNPQLSWPVWCSKADHALFLIQWVKIVPASVASSIGLDSYSGAFHFCFSVVRVLYVWAQTVQCSQACWVCTCIWLPCQLLVCTFPVVLFVVLSLHLFLLAAGYPVLLCCLQPPKS